MLTFAFILGVCEIRVRTQLVFSNEHSTLNLLDLFPFLLINPVSPEIHLSLAFSQSRWLSCMNRWKSPRLWSVHIFLFFFQMQCCHTLETQMCFVFVFLSGGSVNKLFSFFYFFFWFVLLTNASANPLPSWKEHRWQKTVTNEGLPPPPNSFACCHIHRVPYQNRKDFLSVLNKMN